MEYRTTVDTPDDDQDNHPGMCASVDEDGELVIHDAKGNIECTYEPDEWVNVLIEKVQT